MLTTLPTVSQSSVATIDPDEVVYENASCRLSITHRKVTELYLDVMLSPLGLSGGCGKSLTPEQVKGLTDFINLPPSDTGLDRMDEESEGSSKFSKHVVYLVLVLLYEGREKVQVIHDAFGLGYNSISVIRHGYSFHGTWLRYWRDRNLQPPVFDKPGSKSILDQPHQKLPR